MQVAEWMESTVGPVLAARSALVASIESGAGAPVVPFPASSVTELRSSSVVSHTLPSTPPLGAPVTRSRVFLGAAIVASLAIFVVAAVAFRMGAGAREPLGPVSGAPATSTASLAVVAPPEAPPVARPEATPPITADAAVIATPTPAPEREAPPPPRREGRGRGRPHPPAPAAPGSTGDINTLLDTH
jgi:hypothetical protein